MIPSKLQIIHFFGKCYFEEIGRNLVLTDKVAHSCDDLFCIYQISYKRVFYWASMQLPVDDEGRRLGRVKE